MKKKVIIVTKKMVLGGVEKSLISLINSIDKELYDITLLLVESGGELYNSIPNNIKIKTIKDIKNSKSFKERLVYDFRKKQYLKIIKNLFFFIKQKYSRNKYNYYEFISKILDRQKENYDIAISYHVPAQLSAYYTINNIKAKKKILWIHCDINQVSIESQNLNKYYNKYHEINCVSKQCYEVFINKFNKLKDRTNICYNTLDVEGIRLKAIELNPYINRNANEIIICTVARLSYEKGIDIAIDVCNYLNSNNYKCKWYVCGDGLARRELEEKIKKLNLQSQFILLGNINNPYTYINYCDIYVQPSRNEGYCMSLAEARVLNKPIITTDFIGARDQIKNNKTGIITSVSIKNISDSIIELIKNEKKRKELSSELEIEANKDVIYKELV